MVSSIGIRVMATSRFSSTETANRFLASLRMGDIVAVYGTLRRGGPANSLMKGCRYMTDDAIAGRLYDLGDFPVAKVNAAGFAPIAVNLYQLPDDRKQKEEILERIDRYEGYFPEAPDQSLFTRRRTLTIGKNRKWVYVYDYNHPIEAAKPIESGDWFQK